jgi:hypothetical protein
MRRGSRNAGSGISSPGGDFAERCARMASNRHSSRKTTNPRPGVLRSAAAQEGAGPAPDPALSSLHKSPERSRAGTDKETIP